MMETDSAEEVGILLPSDYEPPDDPHTVVRVAPAGAARDCESEWEPGWLLVVEARMIREIAYKESVYHTITENYVVGALVPSDY